MTATDTIRYLSQHPITVLGEQWSPDNVSRQSAYAQYKRRFPAGKSNSLHYEVEKQDDNIHVKVVLHCEGGTDNRDDVLNRLKWTPRHTTDRSKIVDCSLYTPANADDLVTEIGNQMSQIAAVYEPRIQGIENNWGAIANGHQGIDAVGVNVPVGGNENIPEMMIKEIAPAEICLKPIPVGITYPKDVIDPCKISGVFSWITSIGALFERTAITLSDGKVMRPGQYIIPPYQRKYTWSYDNVSQLCRDLIKSKDAGKDTYHLGTIILHHQEGDDGDSFYVVDGQQRLTTISYLINSEIFATGVSSPKIKNSDIKNILSALEEYREEKCLILEQLKRSTLVVIAVSDINEAFQLFSTQNGRGRPLTPANLLKAYHLHELEPGVNAAEEDKIWESNNAEKTPRDGRLLSQVLGEHLYRLRCWSRGEFPKEQFSNADIKEFKGITFKSGNVVGVPCQNLMRLRQYALSGEINIDYCSRSPNDGLNSLSAIDQHIVNGADFFEYMKSYAEAYRVLYMTTPAIDALKEFREFYDEKCNYRRSDRRGDTYARHIFESLCLFCYDRFGADGLSACKRYLYRCAYYERAVKSRCYYGTCGSMYAVQAVRVMSACMTLVDVKDRLHALNGEVLESYRNDKKVFSDKPTPDGVDCVRSVYEE